MTAKVIISYPSEYQGPSDNQGPSKYQGPSNRRFQDWGPLKFRHFFFHFFVGEFGLLPKNSGPNRRAFWFWVGVTLGPWKPPPPWPNPSYVPVGKCTNAYVLHACNVGTYVLHLH